MCKSGEIRPITRHGINRICEGPFRKASFEQTVEQLFAASVFSEVQEMMGITENIMFGQLAPLGTGAFKLLLDREMIKTAKYVPDDHNNKPGDLEMIVEDFENEQEIGGKTPMDMRTPGPSYMDTPGRGFQSPGMDNFIGGFTPTPGLRSPGYNPIEKSVVYSGDQQ